MLSILRWLFGLSGKDEKPRRFGEDERPCSPDQFFIHAELFSYEEARRDQRLDHEPGLYGWYFNQALPGVETDRCVCLGDWALLYIGKAADLRNRLLSDHFTGDAQASTLRQTLGCLLADQLDLRLQRRAVSNTLTFGSEGEEMLTRWMKEHARIAWAPLDDASITWPCPGDAEELVELESIGPVAFGERFLIRRFVLPLNIEFNKAGVCRAATEAREAGLGNVTR